MAAYIIQDSVPTVSRQAFLIWALLCNTFETETAFESILITFYGFHIAQFANCLAFVFPCRRITCSKGPWRLLQRHELKKLGKCLEMLTVSVRCLRMR